MDTQQILLELSELLRQYYNGSFSKMVCEYIRTTGMPSQDVEELSKTMKQQIDPNKKWDYKIIVKLKF